MSHADTDDADVYLAGGLQDAVGRAVCCVHRDIERYLAAIRCRRHGPFYGTTTFSLKSGQSNFKVVVGDIWRRSIFDPYQTSMCMQLIKFHVDNHPLAFYQTS